MLAEVRGAVRLVVGLMYGSGLRLSEALELRVKDLDFDRQQIVVRQGKGRKDRATMMPVASPATQWIVDPTPCRHNGLMKFSCSPGRGSLSAIT